MQHNAAYLSGSSLLAKVPLYGFPVYKVLINHDVIYNTLRFILISWFSINTYYNGLTQNSKYKCIIVGILGTCEHDGFHAW